MPDTSRVYHPRKAQESQYYRCIEDNSENLEQVYDERFAKQHGFFRPYVRHMIYRFLDCGILHNGFARVKCGDCGHEYLLAFSCKRRHFCPSCHQKRVVEFGEWLCEEVLKAVPHRHFVFSIPKILRRYFLYDRKLLSDLSRCGWESLKEFFKQTVPEKGAVPVEDPVPCGGAVIAIQTFGDFLGFNPHLHVLCSHGCFYGEGMFRVAPRFTTKTLEEIFPAKDGIFDRHKVFKMLLSKGKITEDLVDMLMKWRHSGFNVFCGPKIQPGDENAMENLARYIVRASFSQERMTYVPEEAKVVYKSKDRKQEKIFDALEWIAAALKMSKGGIYHYFSSKEEILFFVMDNYMDLVLEDLEPQLKVLSSRESKIKFIIKRHIKLYTNHKADSKTFLHDSNCLSAKYRKRIAFKERGYFISVKR